MVNGIIYKATNTINGMVYIGQTVKELHARAGAHYSFARSGNYPNNYFYRAINKYGEDAFTWEVIDESDSDKELNEKEVYWINHYHSYREKGYNLTVGGGGVRGYKVTAEGIERRSKVLKKRWANGEVVTRKGSELTQSKLSEEDVIKIKDLLIEDELTQIEIGDMFGVRSSTIHSIKRGATWRHVTSVEDVEKMQLNGSRLKTITATEIAEIKQLLLSSPLASKVIYNAYSLDTKVFWGIVNSLKWSHLFTEEEIKIFKNRNRSLSENQVREIKKILLEGSMHQKDIAEMFNVKPVAIGKIKSGVAWAHVRLENENTEIKFPQNEILKNEISKIKMSFPVNRIPTKRISRNQISTKRNPKNQNSD